MLAIIVGETNVGAVNFSIVTENPSGSFLIDENSGELRVNDNSLFDFETNQTLTAIVEVENNGITVLSNVTINLNDLGVCGESQIITENLFYDLASGPYTVFENTLDLVNHTYKFSMSTDGEICSIGYQGANDLPYRIEIINSSDNVIYEGNHTFSTLTQEYVSITPVQINANEIYSINRYKENGSTASDLIGYGLTNFSPGYNFPIVLGEFTITETMNNDTTWYIPFITFGFEQN